MAIDPSELIENSNTTQLNAAIRGILARMMAGVQLAGRVFQLTRTILDKSSSILTLMLKGGGQPELPAGTYPVTGLRTGCIIWSGTRALP